MLATQTNNEMVLATVQDTTKTTGTIETTTTRGLAGLLEPEKPWTVGTDIET